MGDIVKLLHLNKHIRGVQPLTMVNAFNIALSKDKKVICNDTSVIKNAVLNSAINGKKVIGVIPCNKEVIIFLKDGNVIRYNEDVNGVKTYNIGISVSNNDAIVNGTFTYNIDNELIIAYSYINAFDANNKPIKHPLSTINLGKINDKININTDAEIKAIRKTLPICPEVKIPTVTDIDTKGVWYKGWSFIFIRYKVNDRDYTQWYNTNAAYLIDSCTQKVIQTNGGYYINGEGKKVKLQVPGETPSGRVYFNKVTATVSEDTDIINVSKRIILNGLSDYDKVQIGVIISTKTYNKCLISKDISIKDNVLQVEDIVSSKFDIYSEDNNVTTEAINKVDTTDVVAINLDLNNFDNVEAQSELIKTYNNYYNVNCVANVDNRLYIAGFNEDIDEDENVIKELIKDVKVEYKHNKVPNYTWISDDFGGKHYTFTKNDSLIPMNTYRIYIHYVDKYGISTSGYYVNTIKIRDDDHLINNNSDLYGYLRLVLDITGVKLPDNNKYIGYYFSYEKVEQNVKLIGLYSVELGKTYENNYDFDNRKGYVNKVYSTEINTNDKLSIDIDTMILYAETAVYYKDVSKVEYDGTNSSTNIGQIACCKINVGEATRNTRSVGGIEAANNLDKKVWNRIKRYFIKLINDTRFDIIYDSDEERDYKNMVNNDDFSNVRPKCHLHQGTSWLRLLLKNGIKNGTIKSGADVMKHLTTYTLYKDVSYSIVGEYIGDKETLVADLDELFNTISIGDDTIKDALQYVFLIKKDISPLDGSVKTLIPFSSVVYDVDKKPIFYYDGYTTNIDLYKYYENVQVGQDGRIMVIDYQQGNNIYDGQHHVTNPDSMYDYLVGLVHFDFTWITKVPDCFKVINNKPSIIFTPTSLDDKSGTIDTFVTVDANNSSSLFKVVHLPKDDCYPKVQFSYDKTIKRVSRYDKTIRRSNVMQEESFANAWRKFDTEAYHHIAENKGKITNMFAINEMFIVHTEHSLFGMNLVDTLITDNAEVGLGARDLFNTKHKELFTTTLGYGGLTDKRQSIIGTFGYIWFNNATNRLMKLTANRPEFIDNAIFEYTQNIGAKDIRLANDYDRRRLLISYCDKMNNKTCISYDYDINNFISFHNYNFDIPINTESKLYMFNSDGNVIFNFKYNSYGYTNYNDENEFVSSDISFVVNEEYETIKYLDYITYKVKAPLAKEYDNYRDTSPVESEDITYSGYSIRIYNNFIDTGVNSLKPDLPEFNKVMDYTKPYREFGNWNVSFLRDIKNNDVHKVVDDVSSRLYGNYFIVNMTFDKPYSTNRIEIETFNYKFNND